MLFPTGFQRTPQFDLANRIHVQDMCGCRTDRRTPRDHSSAHDEMLIPMLGAWIEKRNHIARFGIKTGEVRPFVQVAVIAREREILRLVVTAVLPRNDVFDVKPREGRMLLR